MNFIKNLSLLITFLSFIIYCPYDSLAAFIANVAVGNHVVVIKDDGSCGPGGIMMMVSLGTKYILTRACRSKWVSM